VDGSCGTCAYSLWQRRKWDADATQVAERLIKEANFREALPLSTFDWNFNPAVPRLQIEALAQGDFLRRRQNLVFAGQSGLGKSRLIQSIGLAACLLEQRVHYITSGETLEDLTAALADQTIHKRVRFYAKFRLLIIDEFGFDRIGGTRSSTPAANTSAPPWWRTSTSTPGPTISATPRWRWPCWIASSTAPPSWK
jgi:DNA replication protein DnaC